ncbi:peptidoglycan-binding domain-containing protein [Saccharothrix sp. NRRL B-16314]|uniref:peptidoglycan-binding domain-containing protein n=1 Tax=Saccharothrix sp. NRRL B-16314 TaxID=1463825 RepID=UPI000A8D8C7C|nr:peptidoglycan-binding domain-containing protein [Saccharothrix sp. NRRL B-16314]
MKEGSGLRRFGVGVAAVLMAVTGVVVSGGSASAATPLCDRMASHHVGGNIDILVPAIGANRHTCLIGSGLVANYKIVVQFQATMVKCYGGLRLASPYGDEFIRDLDMDGSFGPRTQAALKAVQKSVGATVDGSYGPNTRDRMKFVDNRDRYCYAY